MIRKLSISRSTYLLRRRVSFLLNTTVYTSHVFFFTTECCDFGDMQPCFGNVITTYGRSREQLVSDAGFTLQICIIPVPDMEEVI